MSCQTSCWSSSSCTVSPLSLLGGPRRQRGRGRGLDAQTLTVQAELPESSGPLPSPLPRGRGNTMSCWLLTVLPFRRAFLQKRIHPFPLVFGVKQVHKQFPLHRQGLGQGVGAGSLDQGLTSGDRAGALFGHFGRQL